MWRQAFLITLLSLKQHKDTLEYFNFFPCIRKLAIFKLSCSLTFKGEWGFNNELLLSFFFLLISATYGFGLLAFLKYLFLGLWYSKNFFSFFFCLYDLADCNSYLFRSWDYFNSYLFIFYFYWFLFVVSNELLVSFYIYFISLFVDLVLLLDIFCYLDGVSLSSLIVLNLDLYLFGTLYVRVFYPFIDFYFYVFSTSYLSL